MQEIIKLNTHNIESNSCTRYDVGKISVLLYQNPSEPENVNRLLLDTGDFKAELQPSKGLALGQVYYKGKKLFWDAPYSLPDPDTLDLWSDNVLINGEPKEGFEFLKTLCGGIEFYGLKNWGMPKREDATGELLPLHGETSNIPVKELTVKISKNNVIVEAEYIYNDMKNSEPQPWYLNGGSLYRVYKYYEFSLNESPKIIARDTIENICDKELIPDWGYHITFFPYPGSTLTVNSEKQEARGGGKLPENMNTWIPSDEKAKREEVGIIHKNLEKIKSGHEQKSRVVMQNPSGDMIVLQFPSSPYFQIWSCRGGAGSMEFSLKDGKSLLEKNWDGLGIEIGSSALDHDGNTDKTVTYDSVLKPREKKVLELEMEYVIDE